MKSELLAVVSGRKSIRFQMIWTFVASFLTSSVASILIPRGFIFEIPISVIAFVATFGLSFAAYTRHTIKYMQKITEGLTAISEGQLNYRLPSVRSDELGTIARHINAMAEKLESSIEKERQAEKLKMELITGVSHDLRTPLTSIIGYLELLKEKAYRDDEEVERFIANTHHKARQLKSLIDELFEYTRLSQGEAKLETETVDLRAMLNQMLSELEPLANDQLIELDSELPDAPLFMTIDPEKTRRAVDNLLMNALKHSVKPGTVRVSLVSDDGRVSIVVENEGEPISKEQEARLFDRFYKADESRTNKDPQAGTGLGLAITRGIAELHGGQATLRHSEGRFSFAFVVPHEAAK
ncbi:HAMP domain-containing histidine kinase [Cohnella terricola]|uniref:histidine kinase n=1 Tax=Cohnella terricola TaxID=1289167 RepID=A0A559JG24_9BACL|nr:HAMP domain-containing histidine kinase [Cohnella terricola]